MKLQLKCIIAKYIDYKLAKSKELTYKIYRLQIKDVRVRSKNHKILNGDNMID